MEDMAQALDMILTAYQDIGGICNPWDNAYLQEEAEKGLTEFGEACRVVFGKHLPAILSGALRDAQEFNQHSYLYMTDSLNEEDACTAVDLSHALALACGQICEIQRRCQCNQTEHSTECTESAAYYAQAIRQKLDPHGILCPEATDSQLS